MEHKFKRVFAFLLSMLMLMNSVPVNAFATEGDIHDHSAEEPTEHTHSLTYVEAKDASCTEDGNIAYFYCECGKYFYDQEAAAEIPAESIVIAGGHSWGEGVVTTPATEDAEGVMTYTCADCGETKTEEISRLVHTHSIEKAENGDYWVCSGCGSKFADEAGTTVYTEPVVVECTHVLTAHEAAAATCTTPANSAYWSCSECGGYFSDAEGTVEIEEGSWVTAAASHTLTKTEAQDATCETAGNSAYWACAACGKFFSDENGENEIAQNSWVIEGEHSLTKMEAVEASCTLPGTAEYWFCTTCGGCFADESGTQALEYVAHAAHAHSGHTWDFSQGSAVSNNGNTLTAWSTANKAYASAPISISGDVFSSNKVIYQMSEGVTLDSSEDWTVEIIAKGNEAQIGAVFSNSRKLTGTGFIYINRSGEMMLGKQLTSFVTDSGATVSKTSSAYAYYKVSNADYEASILNSGSFDLSAYHTYQLRCRNGVFSFWLDGQKIGDLAMTEYATSHGADDPANEFTGQGETHKGSPCDFTSITMDHVGNGNTAGTNATYGLIADVKYLGIYPGHTYSGDCDTTCNNDGCEEPRTASADHSWDEGEVITEVTETTDGEIKYTCTVCGATKNETITASGCVHVMEKTEAVEVTCDADGNSEYWTCSKCGKFYSDDLGNQEIAANSWVIKSDGHKYAATQTDPSCTSHGATVQTCSVCGDSYEENYKYAFSGHTWDFAKSNASNKGNTLTKVYALKSDGVTERSNGTVEFADGVMTGKTVTMELGETVVLSAEEDWAFEAVLKTASASTSPKVLLAESNMFSEGTSIFLYKTGDLYLAQKGTVGGKNTYWYFKVSDADFDANMPADFDITEYHTYRMECNSGVFSYWLDGEKIGDLAITSSNQARASSDTVHEGMQLDYSTITGKYIGSGNSGSLTTFGFSGDLKYLGIYPGHSWTNACDTTCDNTGCTATRTTEHSWDDGVVTKEPTEAREGVKTYSCTVCGETQTEAIPATVYTWTFDNGTAKSTNGLRTFTYVTTHYNGKTVTQTDTMSVADGVMSVNGAALEMEEGIRVTSDKTWAFEITMKAKSAPKSVLAESKGISMGTSVYMNASGNLMLMKNGTIEGMKDYWWFRVSEADFTANMPEDFNIAEYHTYQLRCENGIFSYWLDGKKIGDLTAYESLNNAGLTYEGNYLDHSDMTFRYMGNGTNANVLNRAFTGDVDSMSIYTDIPAHVHAPEKVEAKASTCSVAGNNEYWVCSCGIFKDEACTEATTVEAETLPLAAHSYGSPVFTWADDNTCTVKFLCTVGGEYEDGTCTVTSETTAGNCQTRAETIYTATAYAGDEAYTDTKTVEGELGAHSLSKTEAKPATCSAPGNEAYWTCTIADCGKVFADENAETQTTVEKQTLAQLAHDYSEPVFAWTEDNTCEASYVCAVGGETETVDCTVTHETMDASCTQAGDTVYTATVKVEGKTYTDTKTINGAGLSPSFGEAAFAWTENGTAASVEIVCTMCNGEAEGHRLSGEAAVEQTGTTAGDCQTKATTTYTATITLNGKVYTEDKTVEGGYGSHKLTGTEAAEATCTENGNEAYWTCGVEGCGKYFSDAEATTEIEKDSWIIPASHKLTAVEAKEAGCTEDGNIAYWICGAENCGKYFSDAEGRTEIEDKTTVVIPAGHKLTRVEAKEATCAAAGNVEHWNCSVCGDNFADENGSEKLESVEVTVLEDHVWDFSQNSVTANTGNTLTRMTSKDVYESFTISGGEWVSEKAIYKMSEAVALNAENDWTFEIVLKGNGTNAVATVLSNGRAFGNASGFVYINGSGDLMIGKQLGSFVTDSGNTVSKSSSAYAYYKVSNADYTNSVLGSGSFDITAYHTYQLRCENGIFSYWLDGEKIGDLGLTEYSTGRSADDPDNEFTGQGEFHKGTPCDFRSMTMDHVGNGTASGTATYGLIATVKSMGIFIYPAHSFDNSCDTTCNNADCDFTRETVHSWDDGEITRQPTEAAAGEITYTCTVCGEKKTEEIAAYTAITMKYDDRLAVSDLGQTGEPVITTKTVTSKKVGTTTLDDAVIAYVDGKLIAVGVGTALVGWDDAVYSITVEPATISMLMVTGHSLGSGSQGDKNQTIVCEEGQVYSTSEKAYDWKLCTGDSAAGTVECTDVSGMGIGYGSEKKPEDIDLLNESGAGVQGMDSALGYRWAQLTGEKVWILNSAKGSTSLQTWQKGGYNYRHAVLLFNAAQEIMYNEVQAGHFILNKMGIVNYTTANGDQSWSMNSYTTAFNSMWDGFRGEMAVYDYDADGTTDTVDCIGLLPLWSVCSMNGWDNMHKEPLSFNNGKLINYFMSAYGDNGVILASNVGRSWTTDADVAAYFAKYPIENLYGTLQNGTTHTSPTTLQNGVYGDGVHYAQLGYNVQGIETAESMYEYWYGKNELQSLKLLQSNGVDEVPAAIEIAEGKTYAVIADALPTSAKLTYELSGDAASYDNCLVTGEKVGTAVLTVKDLNGNILKTVDITVREATDEDYANATWYSWDFSKASATNTAGSDLNNTLTLVKTDISDVTTVEELLADGTLNASAATTMQLSESIRLTTEEDWAVELVAKGNGTDAIRTFLSTGKSMSTASYVYINESGDLSIVKKGSFTADDGTVVGNGYTYYKVSDEDYAANMPADFDVTQYHSYQLRCLNGVFSYWLDGQKIGDLSLSEQTTVRGDEALHCTSGNGTEFNFSIMTMNYVGTGSSSNSASQGLTATVRELNLYSVTGKVNLMVGLDAVAAIDPLMAFPGEEVILPKPDTGDYCAKFVCWAENQDGTGTLYGAGDTYTVTGFAPVSLYGIWDASETTDGVHSFVNGICTNCGSADKNYIRGYVWDFEAGQPTSTDGQYTFSLVTTHGNGNALTNGTMTVADGVMSLSKTALELNDSIRLTSDKTWVFDITMKTDAAKGKNLLAENKKISVGTSIHLSTSGSLGLMKHGTLEGREAADYWIYQVSAADLKANMPADFDITEYHTYQLRCEEGVFSYWLDGKKIGDLSITKNINSPYVTHEGAQFDYSDISLKYMSNGVSGNVLFYGVAGEIEQLRVFPEVGAAQHLHAVSGVEAAEATCTEAGNTEYWTCGACGKYFSDAEATTEIEKDSWIIAAKGHSLTATEEKPVSCTEDGNTAYWTCGVCGKYFRDADGKNEIEKDAWIIAAPGHQLEETPAKAASCTENGNSAYWTCGTCGKYFSDAEASAEIEKDSWIIAASGHDLKATEEKEATCMEAGNSAYWTCDTCGTYFSDAEGENEIEKDSWIISQLDHNYSEPAFVWAEDNTCTASYTCSVGNETETADCQVSYETEDATCTTAGTVVYTASIELGGKTYTETKTVSGEPLGHSYGEADFTWAEDGLSAEATVTCSACAADTEGHSLSGSAVVMRLSGTEGDCQTRSTVTYLASIELGGKSYTDKVTVEGGYGSHKLTGTEAAEATCTEDGNSAYWTCGVEGCGKYFSDAEATTEIEKDSWIIPGGHKLTAVEAREAGCTEDGNTAYWTCGTCGKYFSDAEGRTEIEDKTTVVIPAGHKLTKVEAKEATCAAAGNVEHWNCSVCGDNFADENGSEKLEAVEIAMLKSHIWNFAEGSTASDNGNTLTKVYALKSDGVTERPNGTVEFADGVMSGNTVTLQLSETIELNSAKGWTLEATLKANADSSGAAIAPRVLLAESNMFSEGTSVYLGGEGNLLLAQKGTVKSKNAYWYFMVSDADFDANMPADFDATQEHTYRLECVNGTFTYWLDGKRIGDLSITSNSMGRSGTEYDGQYLDYSTIIGKYIGSGNSGSLKTFGFSGEMKKLEVSSGHSYTNTCDATCNNEGCTHTREVWHLWNEGEVITEVTETTDGQTKYTCTICGETKTETVPALGHIHVMTKTDAVDATCKTPGNSAYWTCSSCGKYYSDAEGETEIEKDSWIIPVTDHVWDDGQITKEATATQEGTRTYTCTTTDCGETKIESIPISIYVWTFEDGTTKTVNGLSELSLVTTLNSGAAANNGTMTVADGVMSTATAALELSDGITLTDTENWAVEYILKAHTNSSGAVIKPAALLAEDKQYSNGVTVYLDASGSLKLMKKGTVDGVEDYWNYSVSSADLKANKPADFDMTEYHTYRMECKDGVFSYWLDGKKMGDLTVTVAGNKKDSDGKAYSHEGAHLDYSTIDAKFIGNGSSTNIKTYGLTGDVEEIAIYASAHTHVLTKTDAVAASCDKGGSSAYWTCDICGRYYSDTEGMAAIAKDAWVLEATDHSFTNDCDATCNNDGCTYTRETSHAWDEGTVTVAPTEDQTGVRTYTCTVCGETKTEEVPAVGHTHSMIKTEAKEASCTETGNIAYWTCSICGKHYAEETGANELGENEWITEIKTHTLTKVDAVEGTCAVEGVKEHWTCDSCGKLFADENGTTEIEAPESSGVVADHIWDFSTGSAVSNSGNALSFYSSYADTTKDTDIVLSDGVWASSRTVAQMSQPVTLDAAYDWTMEMTAKGHSGGAIRTVFSTHATYGDACFIYIDGAGDLSLAKKGAYTPDGAAAAISATYTYYKVSDADFAANMPAGFDINEYHTYQLRCEKGVFSYWLDGAKIGDLALTETSPSRSGKNPYTAGTGTPFASDFSSMTINYLGNGASSKNSQYGLTADVKSLAIYPAHSYTNSCDATCDNEGCTHTREIWHAWDIGTITKAPTEDTEGERLHTCISCGATKTETIPAIGKIVLAYDDRLPIADLGQKGEPVITTKTVTSKKVGTDTPDDAVLTYVDGVLVATGVGTATATWGTGSQAVDYNITVEPATISMIMVTGHSLGSGSQGTASKTIVCEEGQVYATNERAYDWKITTGSTSTETVEGTDVTGMGLGYSSELRPKEINELNPGGGGVNGVDSAIAYQWTKLTGEKLWILNSAKGSTSLSTWQAGGFNYRHAVELFTTAEEIMYNEVQAGHYKLNKMGIVNFTTANGDQSWAADAYRKAFNSMWDGFQEEMALYDFDGDGTTDTVDCISLLPLWNVCSMNKWDNLISAPLAFFRSSSTKYYGKLINYAMSYFEDEGVTMGSTIMREWTSDADVAAYFKANPVEEMYGKLQDGSTHTSPTTVRNGVYGDGVHYGQLGYNVLGIDIAKNMYSYWYGQNDVTSLRLLQSDGVTEVPETIAVRVGEEYPIAPEVVPASAKLTYSLSGNAAAYENCIVTGASVGSAVLTIADQDGNVLKTVNIIVEPAEEDEEDVVWYSWDFSKASATNTTGSTTDNTLTLVKSSDSAVTSMEDLLKDQTLAATNSATMAFSKSITLDSSKNWAVELVAKSEGANSIRSFLSTDVTLSGTYFFIDGNGDLSIVTKGSFKADDGTTVASGYTYYKVSDEDFSESILDSGSFDITQFHSYQLRCTDGVFSYWLDGEKIGDLSLSEQTTVRGDDTREYTKNKGTPFDFSKLTMTHIGCGSANNAASQGLTATVKELNIYSNSGRLRLEVGLDAVAAIAPMSAFPGESVVLPKPNNGMYCAKFLYWAENQDGTGTRYQPGDIYTVTSFEPTSLYGVWQAFETTDGIHTYVDGVCTSCGAADGSYYPWDIWDFEDGSAIADDESNTIGRITTNHAGSAVTNNGSMVISDGIMHVGTAALEMSESITLSADEDWAFDFTMKANVDANGEVITPKTLLAEDKLFSVGTSFYLTSTGDLLMAQKGTVGSSNTYWYFKVSNADFKANMPEKFDITQYHTYRVMCIDGVFSYWLDGEKIGDFALTSNSMSRGGTTHAGQKLDYSKLTLQHIGNGNTGNCKAFGFTGDVERIAIYQESGYLTYKPQNDQAADIAVMHIYPGEKITLAKPDTGEYCVRFTGWTKTADGSGTVYPAGSVYNVSGVEELTLYGNWEESATTVHTYGKGVITAPTCAEEGYTTYTCTVCGHEKVTDPVAKSAHSFKAEIAAEEFQATNETYDTAATYYRSCEVCGLSSKGTGGESTFESGRPGDGYYTVVSKQDWDTAPGITESEIILNNSTGERRQAVHVMQVDISDPYASILPSYMGMNPTQGNYKLGTMSQQANWVEQNMGLNVVGAMNTCLSWYDSAYYDEHPEQKNEPLGILVIDGELYSQNTSAKTCLVVNYDEKDGVQRPADIPKVELRYTKDGVTGWEEQVVSCNFDFIVKDGKNTSSVSHVNQSSKSVLGVKADGTIVIMQNDGEQAPYSNGMSIYEIGETMITLGCVYAVRCDGGGTSTYLSQRPGEELAVTCSPADGAERPTTSGILVISSAPATGEFMRASITSEDTYYAPGCTVEFDVVGTDLVGTKVDVPEDAIWQIKEDGMGTIENGVFVSNGTTGKVTVQIVYNGRIVGEHSIEIVVPEAFRFQQSVITVPYGKTIDIPMTATINGGLNTVVLNPDDIVFTTDNEALGTFEGMTFTAVKEAEAPSNQKSTVTATMKSTGLTAMADLNLGKASIVIDDFEDGINRWNMRPVTSRPVCDYLYIESNASNGYVHSGDTAAGMIMDNHTQMQEAGYYAQFMLDHVEPLTIESANSVGAWIYVPDDFYNLWIRMSFYTQDENGQYTKRNIVNCVEGGEVYTTIEESGWHYFSCDISSYESVQIKTAFIEILSQHCSANALYQTTGSPHGMSAIYVDDVIVDYSDAADDREAPVFGNVTMVAGGTETALYKRAMASTSNSTVSFRAAVSENENKVNATGLDGKSAKAYVDGVPVAAGYSDGMVVVQGVSLADGAHRVRFEISDNAGNTAAAIRVINVASGIAASTIEVVPADPTLDRLYGGSVYWMDLNATMIETIQTVSFDIDLNAVNHWELDHMELAEGFGAAYTVDARTNTATITITRTGDVTQTGKQTLASLPIRVIYFDTDIALEGYTAQTFWTSYNFWPQDVAVDVDRGVITYVEGYAGNVRNTFSSREYSIDTEMYTSSQHMDPAYKAQRGTAHVHTVRALDDMVGSCTETGYAGRTYCDVCESVVEWGTTVSAPGHKYVDINGIMACEVCGEKLNGILDGKHYTQGVLSNGWVDETYYYVDGEKITGHYVIDGRMHTFDENGVYDPEYIYTDFYETEDGKLMYFANNEPVTGYQYLEGEPYYFDENGYGLEGEHIMAGETCLFEKGQYISCSTAKVLSAGMIGPNATYVHYADGTFKIDGYGDTYDFPNYGTRPYVNDSWSIKTLKVAAEITGLGEHLMRNTSVASVEFEEGSELRTIGVKAFSLCTRLTEIELPYTVTDIKSQAFYSCTGLEKAVVPVSVTYISSTAFAEWERLTMYVVDGSYAMQYAIKYNIPYVTYTPAPEAMDGIVWLNGEMYYYRNGEPYYAGLIEIDGDYYYVNSSCKIVTGRYYVNKNNDLMPKDFYEFAEDGKMIIPKNGIYEEDGALYYYKNGSRFYAGLIEIDGDYYYVNSSGRVVTGEYYVNKNNGLMESKVYKFDETGKMDRRNGIVRDEDGVLRYYEDGFLVYAGLIEIDGDYYYVNSKYLVVTGEYYVSKNNGLMESDLYLFDEDGKMNLKTGIFEEDGVLRYYRNGFLYYAGLIEIDGEYYYVNSKYIVVTGKYGISKTNGLMPGAEYMFDETGKMIRKDGIIEEDGVLYYYKRGEKVYAGLIEIDGYYYYVNSSCIVVTGEYTMWKTNALLDVGTTWTFDETGKMIDPPDFEAINSGKKTGIFEEDGILYYYRNGQKFSAGLIEIDGNYYYVNSSCQVVTGYYYVNRNNDLMPKGYYTFDETGKMIIG